MLKTKRTPKTKSILIVHDNPNMQQDIKNFFSKIFPCEFEVKKNFVKTYEVLQKSKSFDVVVVPDVIRGIVEGGFGEDLVPCIRNSSSANNAKICIFTADDFYYRRVKNAGADLCFHTDVFNKKIIVWKLSRTPIVFIPKTFKFFKFE